MRGPRSISASCISLKPRHHSPPMAYLNSPGKYGPAVDPQTFAAVYMPLLAAFHLIFPIVIVTHSIHHNSREHNCEERSRERVLAIRPPLNISISVHRPVIWNASVVCRPVWRICGRSRCGFCLFRGGLIAGEMNLIVLENTLQFSGSSDSAHDED
jgi:hypothetical protein